MSGITLPKTLTDQRLPDDVAYNFQKLVKQLSKITDYREVRALQKKLLIVEDNSREIGRAHV